jgi:hypothetical protein
MTITVEQCLFLLVLAMINMVMLIYLATFVYSFIKFEAIRKKVIEFIEDGDTVGHTKDAFKAVTLSFAIVFGWSDINVMLIWAAFPEHNLMYVAGGFTIVFGGLLGISFREGKHVI